MTDPARLALTMHAAGHASYLTLGFVPGGKLYGPPEWGPCVQISHSEIYDSDQLIVFGPNEIALESMRTNDKSLQHKLLNSTHEQRIALAKFVVHGAHSGHERTCKEVAEMIEKF